MIAATPAQIKLQLCRVAAGLQHVGDTSKAHGKSYLELQ